MKIIFFGSDYAPTGGGIATHTGNWLSAISKVPDVTGSVVIFGNKEPRTLRLGNLSVSTLRSANFFYIGYKTLVTFIRNFDADVFHAFNLFPVGFWTVYWSFVFRKKSVLTFYGADATDKRSSRKTVFLQKWALDHATHLVTISHFTKNIVSEKYDLRPSRINIVYPVLGQKPIEVATLEEKRATRKGLGFEADDFVVTAVCRVVKRKGLEYLIEAAGKLTDPKIKILIVGDGKERPNLEERVKALGLEGKIKFTGRVPKLEPYYAISDVGVLLSYYIKEEGDFEGLGLVLIEAQSFGKPVIGTKSGGIPDAFLPNETGLLVPEQNAEAIAEAILKLKNDEVLYKKMSAATPSFLEQRFDEGTIKRYLEIVGK